MEPVPAIRIQPGLFGKAPSSAICASLTTNNDFKITPLVFNFSIIFFLSLLASDCLPTPAAPTTIEQISL